MRESPSEPRAAAVAPDLALQALSRARAPREAADAVATLRRSLWERLLWALSEPSAREVAEIADRLAGLCETLLHASLADPRVSLADPRAAPGDARAAPPDSPAHPAHPQPAGAGARSEPRERAAAAAMLDERGRADALIGLDDPGSPPLPEPQAPALSRRLSSRPAGTEPTRGEEPAGAQLEQPWLASVEAELRRFERDHRPFAVLLVELREIERLRALLAPVELERLSAELARELTQLLPGAAQITQSPGRHWLIASATDAGSARVLASRANAALEARARAGGVDGGVAVGLAVCPTNGRDAAALAGYAEVDLFAARSPVGAPA